MGQLIWPFDPIYWDYAPARTPKATNHEEPRGSTDARPEAPAPAEGDPSTRSGPALPELNSEALKSPKGGPHGARGP